MKDALDIDRVSYAPALTVRTKPDGLSNPANRTIIYHQNHDLTILAVLELGRSLRSILRNILRHGILVI
jgi:hypothetical protein